MTRQHFSHPILSAALIAISTAVAGLSGCSLGTIQTSGVVPTSGGPQTLSLSGNLHGGQQPVAGASVQLYAAGMPAAPTLGGPTGGYGQGAIAMMATPVSTDINGYWTITSKYNCATLLDPSTPVYIVATGGNPEPQTTDTIGAINNQYIALMVSLGPCNGLTSSTHIQINEVTTVAAVWAMQQFLPAPDGTHAASSYTAQGGSTLGAGVNIGAPSGPVGGYGNEHVQTAVIGLRNASAMVDNLTDYATGLAIARNSWANPWSAKINTLANIIAACINSDPTSSTTCSDLMTAAKPSSGNAPLDTIQAAYYMARNPTNNVAALTALASPTPPFGGGIAAPVDFSVVTGLAPVSSGTTFALSSAVAAAFDEYGRLWVANLGPTGIGASVVELDTNGKFLAGPFSTYSATGGYQVSSGVYKPDPCSPSYTHTLFYSGTGPKSLAIDQNNVVWVSNSEETVGAVGVNCNTVSNRSVMRLNGSSADGTGGGVTTGRYVTGAPYALAVDGTNNVWNVGSSSFISDFIGATASYASGTTAVGSSPQGGAVDMAGNVWFDSGKACTGSVTGILYQVPATSSSAPTITAGYYPSASVSCAGGTVKTAATNSTVTSIATDANNGLWETSNTSGTNTVSYYLPSAAAWTTTAGATISSDGALTSAASVGGITSPYAVGVDGSNRAWVGNNSGDVLSVLSATIDSTPKIVSIQSALPTSTVGAVTYNGLTFPNSSNPFQKGVKGALIDPSGNVWLLNSNTSTAITWTTVVVGAATPVVTPLTYQVKYNLVGQAPQ